MKHDVLKHSSFFTHMDDFGYFRDLEHTLPADFTAVFEIARVLEDENSALFRSIEPVMTVARPEPKQEQLNTREWKPNRNVPNGEEYEAELIRSVSDIKRIFPHQHLLPDQVFMQRLARRSLWVNVPKTPIILPYKSSGTEYNPNNFKQKVYLLLDTSSSMSSHHRYQMAKAVAYVFLKRNLRELGHIYFRTFDTELGPLQIATDPVELQRLIRYIMLSTRFGNGTIMERAILQAAADIRARSALSGAEMLIITDGAAHLDIPKIRESLGETIRINTIKIGDMQLPPDDKALGEMASRGSLPRQISLAKLEEELRRAKIDLRNTSSDREAYMLKSQVNALQERVNQLRGDLIVKLREQFGREIEILSRVFVNIDDISSDSIFILQQAEIEEMKALLAEVEEDFRDGLDADSLREAALLHEHVQLLLKMATDEEQKEQLNEMQKRLNELLQDVLQSGIKNPTSMTKSVSRHDIQDLQKILHMHAGEGDSLLAKLLSFLMKLLRFSFSDKTPKKKSA